MLIFTVENFDHSLPQVFFIMTFIEIMTPDYILVCLLSFTAVVYTIFRILRSEPDEPRSDDDSDGGEELPDFPLTDLPTGVVTLDDYENEKHQKQEEEVFA